MTKRDSDNPQAETPTDEVPNAEQAATAEVADSSASVDDLRRELDEANERALRASAELENFRKRARREQEDERRYANTGLLRDLLPVLDNVQRAIDAAKQSNEAASLVEGFEMVGRMLDDVLARHHCTRIEALHALFDPHFHEAISQQPTLEHPPETVVADVQSGYRLHDRVVRPTQVIVACPPPSGEQAATEES